MRSHSSSAPTPSFAIGSDTTPSRTARTCVPCSIRMSTPRWNRSPRVPRTSPKLPATSCGPVNGATGHSSGTRSKASASNCGRTAGDVGGRSGSCEVAATSRTSALPASATTSWPGRSSATPEGRRNRAVRSLTVAEPDTGSGQRPNRAVRTNGHDAPAVVGHVQFAVGADRNAERPEEPVAVCPRRCGGASVEVHGAHDAVPGVGDIDEAASVEGEPRRRVEARAVRHAVTRARTSRARERPDHAVGLDHADAVVVGVRDDDATVGSHRDADRPVEPGLSGRTVRVARGSVAGERRHDAIGADAADGVTAGVGHVQRAVAGERQAGRCAEPARHGGDAAIRRDAPNLVRLAGVRHEDRPVWRRRRSRRVPRTARRLRARRLSPASWARAEGRASAAIAARRSLRPPRPSPARRQHDCQPRESRAAREEVYGRRVRWSDI